MINHIRKEVTLALHIGLLNCLCPFSARCLAKGTDIDFGCCGVYLFYEKIGNYTRVWLLFIVLERLLSL